MYLVLMILSQIYYNYEIINAKIFTINVKINLLICSIYIQKIC